MYNKKIYFGSGRYTAIDDFKIDRCSKSNRYGHFAKICQETFCAFCSEKHETKICTQRDKLKCHNCLCSNNKYILNINTAHAAADRWN